MVSGMVLNTAHYARNSGDIMKLMQVGKLSIVILTALFTKSALAKNASAQEQSPTCAQVLKKDLGGSVLVLGLIPVMGWIEGVFRSPQFIRQGEDVARLNAATIVVNNSSSERDIRYAKRYLDIFYRKLKKKYPDMTMDKDTVILALDKFNIESVKAKDCRKILQGKGLVTELFPHVPAKYLPANDVNQQDW